MGWFILKIILLLVCIAAIIFVDFFFILIASFSGEGNFYAPFIIVLSIVLIVWLAALIFRLLSKKHIWYSFTGIVFSSAIVLSVYLVHKNYVDSIPVFSDSEVDLELYEPFSEDTKAIFLDEEPTLRLNDSLPRINGATALYPLYSAFVQAVYPTKEYNLYSSEVQGGTTPVAYEALINGDADIIFCAGPSQTQIEAAQTKGIRFVLIPIGYEAFVFFVNKENSVRNLTVEQIQAIYSEKLTNWKEVGGKNEEIKAYQRPKNSGSQTMLEKIMGDIPLMIPPRNNIAGGMGEIIDRTANYKNFDNALGYSFLFFATQMVQNSDIEIMKINGIYPDKNTIRNKDYPFTGEFYAITTNECRNPNVQSFIDWILSPQGQLLVEKTGYVPIK